MNVKPVIVGEVGSFAHGVNIETSDHDYHGIYIESQDSLLGLAAEQGVVRDREAGVERAKPGQKETTLFPLRQYVRMITDGNPTAFPLMYTPVLTVPDQIDIQFIRHDFLSKRLIPRHMGYADKVIEEFTGRRKPSVNRPELVQKYGYDCYLDDTEFLTRRGWMSYDDVEDFDEIATINQETGRIEFQRFTERVSKPYSGEILIGKTYHSQWAVTPNHRMRVAKMLRGPCGRWERRYNGTNSGPWHFTRADSVLTRQWYQQVAAVPNTKEYPVSDEYLALMGAFVSEGTVAKFLQDGTPSVLSFTQADGGRLHETMTLAAQEFEFRSYHYDRKEESRKPYTMWTLADRQVAKEMVGDCGYGSARVQLPSWTLDLSERQANLLLQSMLNGDGTPKKVGWVYYTTSPKLAGDVQALAILAGRRANVRGPYRAGIYQVLIHDSGETPYAPFVGRNIERITVKDRRIVCFTVPNETLVTRRNGHVAMHGNTKHAYHAVRLLLQGAELLTMGLITMPMQAEYREMLLSIRRGGYSKQEVIEVLDELSALIEFSGQTSPLPDYPDYGKINDWLIHTHNEYWSRT